MMRAELFLQAEESSVIRDGDRDHGTIVRQRGGEASQRSPSVRRDEVCPGFEYELGGESAPR